MLRRITGGTSTTGSSPASRRDPTAANSIARGYCARGSRHDALRLGRRHLRCRSRRGLSAFFHPLPKLIWNASASVPIGLYVVHPIGELHASELVVVQPPGALASFLDERRYLPKGVPMLKRILALPGQTVCRADRSITVDGIAMGEALDRDSPADRFPSGGDASASLTAKSS